MLKLKPQTRFLLRGSVLLVGLLSLWWFLLLSPMLYLLKGAAGAFLLIQENPSGDWTLRVPLEKALPATPQQPVAQQPVAHQPAAHQPAPQPAPAVQPRLSGLDPKDRLSASRAEEDLLDIPAFLRRQAN